MGVANFTSTDVQVKSSPAQNSTTSPVTSEMGFSSQAVEGTSFVLKNIKKSTLNHSNFNTTTRRKSSRTSSNQQRFSTLKPPHYKRRTSSFLQGNLPNSVVKDEPHFEVQRKKAETNVTGQRVRHCATNFECGLYAECVAMDQLNQCWCVNELIRPDPETGECGSNNHDNHKTDHKNGVVHLENMRGMFHDNINTTQAKATNETSSKLHLKSNGSASDVSLLQIIPAVFGSVIFVSIVLAVSIIYRRRHLGKHFCVIRNGDLIVRNNDGTLLLDRMNNISKNPTYFCPNNSNTKRHNVKEVDIEHLKLLEVVGEGAFGQVFRGELYIPESESHKDVAIKVLKDGANREAREDFDREVEIMSSFDHDNILKLLCVIIEGTHGNPYMIFEYMEHGDLSELLRKNDPHFKNSTGKRIVLTKIDMVDVSVQIATGMCYLATQRFVHRDLATRNCLVGGGLIVKISDFGMSRDVYTTDYYRIGGSRMLPVRWMSPEAIKYGRFTSESDIWAYGVVLWEIFSFGRQPYCGHTNEEVLHFLDQGILLQRPEDCPSTVYHVMLGCWKIDPKERLLFDRLVKHLTEYRNRLMKSPHIHHQSSNPGADIVTTLHGSGPQVRLGGQDKVGSGDINCDAYNGSDTGNELNYLTLIGDEQTHSERTGVLADNKCSVFVEKEECVSSDNCKLDVSNSFKESLINSSAQDAHAARMCENNYEKNTCERRDTSVSSSCLTQGINNGIQSTVVGDFHHQELKKIPVKRLASYPSFGQTGKTSHNRSRSNKQYGSLKHVPLKHTAELLENKIQNFSVSALELCPRMTSVSQNTSLFTYNQYIKSAHHIHTKCGSINHMTNKVTDKSPFPEQQWNVKSQNADVADGCLTFSRFADTLDLHSVCSHPQREVAINEYSIPGQPPV